MGLAHEVSVDFEAGFDYSGIFDGSDSEGLAFDVIDGLSFTIHENLADVVAMVRSDFVRNTSTVFNTGSTSHHNRTMFVGDSGHRIVISCEVNIQVVMFVDVSNGDGVLSGLTIIVGGRTIEYHMVNMPSVVSSDFVGVIITAVHNSGGNRTHRVFVGGSRHVVLEHGELSIDGVFNHSLIEVSSGEGVGVRADRIGIASPYAFAIHINSRDVVARLISSDGVGKGFTIEEGVSSFRINSTISTSSSGDMELVESEDCANLNILINIVDVVNYLNVGVVAVSHITAAVVRNLNDMITVQRVSNDCSGGAHVGVNLNRIVDGNRTVHSGASAHGVVVDFEDHGQHRILTNRIDGDDGVVEVVRFNHRVVDGVATEFDACDVPAHISGDGVGVFVAAVDIIGGGNRTITGVGLGHVVSVDFEVSLDGVSFGNVSEGVGHAFGNDHRSLILTVNDEFANVVAIIRSDGEGNILTMLQNGVTRNDGTVSTSSHVNQIMVDFEGSYDAVVCVDVGNRRSEGGAVSDGLGNTVNLNRSDVVTEFRSNFIVECAAAIH